MLRQSVEHQTGCGQYDVPCNTCAFISSTDHSVLKDHPEVQCLVSSVHENLSGKTFQHPAALAFLLLLVLLLLLLALPECCLSWQLIKGPGLVFVGLLCSKFLRSSYVPGRSDGLCKNPLALVWALR